MKVSFDCINMTGFMKLNIIYLTPCPVFRTAWIADNFCQFKCYGCYEPSEPNIIDCYHPEMPVRYKVIEK